MGEVLFEFVFWKRHVRVSALDPETGEEVVVVADARQSVEYLKMLAGRKLRYMQTKTRAKKTQKTL